MASPVLGGYYFGRVLAGVARVLHAGSHRVVAVQTYPADLDRAEFPVAPRRRTLVGTTRFDGLIVVTTALDDAALRRIDDAGTPLVLIGVGPVEGVSAPHLGPDNAGGVRAAIDHLVAHGHRRIGFLGNTDQTDTHERLVAYRDALLAHGIEPRTDWLYRTRDNQEASAEAAARRLVERDGGMLGTTATLAATDRNAVGFMRGLHAEGLPLPSAQAVIGIDHSDLGARIRPRLSSVDLLHDAVGERAAELVLAMMRGERATGEHRLDRSTLVLRESCGCEAGARGAVVVTSRPPDAASTSVPGGNGAAADAPGPGDRGKDSDRGNGERRGNEPCEPGAGRPAATAAPAATASAGMPEAGLDVVAPVVLAREHGRDAWVAAVRRVLTVAADQGLRAPAPALRALADATARLRPAPDALEHLVPSIHAEAAWTAGRRRRVTARGPAAPGRAARRAALEETVRDVVVALARGTVVGTLGRAGRLEAEMAEQYEVDLELMRADGAALRSLEWLPRGHASLAALALWVDDAEVEGGRALQVVGVGGSASGVERLVGTSYAPHEFPPPELTDPTSPTLVVSVGFGSSDRGVLLVSGLVDTRATSTRARHNHWAAMLAVALDAEDTLSALEAQRRELADAAERERVLALEVAASHERTALVSIASHDGTWDWDVEAGRVRYSDAWARIVGCDPAHVGDDPQEWLGRVHPDDARRVQSAVAAQLSGSHEPFDVEHRLRTADGRHVVVRCRAVTVHDAGGRAARMVGAMAVVPDVTQVRSELRERVLVDTDTGLVARDLFVDRLERAIVRARRVDAYGWQVLAVGFTSRPQATSLHRLHGELDPNDCAYGAAPHDVVVLLDGADVAAARDRAARLRAILGPGVVVEHCAGSGTAAAGGDAVEVLRRAGDCLGHRRADVLTHA
ncbi:putative PAS/PAC sensor protein [Xylanimonas cellulosilytica DSM 15894]|uniref:PAS/PAC sensor protein n=1 Tax=Xylanimonas cellulosilytica (strain DSM 15894 / JCM 12276 / CECT 5975 / KCTC 9989 / LMG 20990 / NBRC 107835 / XIL07) TaxID=446471 RepID=D1BZM9_XYLCX|nr:putative PAS/PAC sensor protein [Xylanimonas cellulosilytica DSM 15894]